MPLPLKNTLLSILFLLAWGVFPIFGDTSADFYTDLSVQWSSGKAELSFTFPLSVDQHLSPQTRSIFTRKSISELGFSFVENLSRLQLNSRQTLGDFLKKNPEAALRLTTAAEKYTSSTSSFARDYSEFRITFTYNLYPNIIEHLFSHTSEASPDPLLRYIPSGTFSGIVIYVEEELPVHGTSSTGNITPCFFPKVFNEQMELIVSKEMLSPGALRNRGMAGYFPKEKIDSLPSRVGEVPLYIKAKALFGKTPTDIIIPMEGADTMLSSDHTIRLITEGKIAVVYITPSH